MGFLSNLCYYLPVFRHKIVFSSYNGKGYGDNPKYIAEELIRQNRHYDLVWLVNDMSEVMPREIRKVQLFSRQGRFELSTAKVIVNNVKIPLPYEKKKNQYYIQTWHGDFPLKYIEGEVEDKLSPGYLEASKKESKQIDLLISGTKIMTSVYQNYFWYQGEIFECGLPRNDVFFQDKETIIFALKKNIGVNSSSKIALYAPTFRNEGYPFPLPDFQLLREQLLSHTGDDWVIIVRFHPNDISKREEIRFTKWLLDGSTLPDMQDLEIASDLLITDYSSSIYDFLLQRKPIIRYVPDLDYYIEQRGLRDIYWSIPIPLCKNDNDLNIGLNSVFADNYKEMIDHYVSTEVGSFDTGIAASKIVERINSIINDA